MTHPQQLPFNQPRPAKGEKEFEWNDHIGQLVLIEPKGVSTGIQTDYGLADAVEGDVAFIDAPGGPMEFENTRIFPKVLVSQCKDSIGSMVLGRIAAYQPRTTRPTVQLMESTPQDQQMAMAYLNERNARRASGQFNQPAASNGAPPVQQQYQQGGQLPQGPQQYQPQQPTPQQPYGQPQGQPQQPGYYPGQGQPAPQGQPPF